MPCTAPNKFSKLVPRIRCEINGIISGGLVTNNLHHHRLRWLGHVLRMSDDRLPRRALFAEPKSSWKRPSGGQHMTWQRNMKSLTEGLSRVGNVRLAGWGPRDPSHLWLETLSDMACSRSQWRSCTFSLALSS